MIRSVLNRNKTLNYDKFILFDNDNKNEININIDENNNKEKGKYIIETITPIDEDFKIHNNRKKFVKDLKSNLKLKNTSQMAPTDVFMSNDDKKLKNIIKKKKDKDMNSNKPINKRKRQENYAIINNLSSKREKSDLNGNKNNIGNMKLKNKKVSYAYTDEELQEMKFEEALFNDNRPFIRICLI